MIPARLQWDWVGLQPASRIEGANIRMDKMKSINCTIGIAWLLLAVLSCVRLAAHAEETVDVFVLEIQGMV